MDKEYVRLLEASRIALDYYDRNACPHENTHRGGFIWTICDDCGKKWADDEGGFVAYSDPPHVAELRDAITALDACRPTPPSDTVPLRINCWINNWSGERCVVLEEDDNPEDFANSPWSRVATITANVPASPPAVPVIEGECEA